MSFDEEPRSEIDATCSTSGEALVRRFSCACCHRIWHLIDDERVWQAVEVAERFATAGATVQALDEAKAWVAEAIEARAREEWEAEADFG